MSHAAKKKHLILVADLTEIRRLVETAFAVPDCSVVNAADDAHTLAIARRDAPALIVVPLDGGGINGPAVIARLKRGADTASIPVLGLLNRTGCDLHAESVGVDAVLQQPVTPTVVAEIGRLLIERAMLIRQRSAGDSTSAAPRLQLM